MSGELQRQRVALESTVIAHGLAAPHNIEAARRMAAAVKASGAEPAMVAIIAGRVAIGIVEGEIEALASRDGVAKVSLHNLGATIAGGGWGATTVAATLHLAAREGIRVFATGGIGGVHREAHETFDISADLAALAANPIVTVSAGVKSVLDLPKTIEALETLGVPVVGYRTNEFPAFYSRESGLAVPIRAESPQQIAEIAHAHWSTGLRSAVLVTVPCPAEAAIPSAEISVAIAEAIADSRRENVTGSRVTPYLLAKVAAATGGRAVAANLALLENNARLAGEIAMAIAAESCGR